MTDDFTLAHGPGTTPDQACVMQRAALQHAELHGYLTSLPLDAVMTDRPCWANEALTAIAIFCNDRLSDEDRQRLKPLLARILRAERRSPEVERRINARILCHQARKVLHLVRPDDRDACETAIATREAWLDGEATEEEAVGAAWAAEAVGAAGAAEEPDWVEWLDEALDVWEKAVIEEDALFDDAEAKRLVAEFVAAGGS